MRLLTADVWGDVRAARLAASGLPPVAGGLLDQAAQVVEAMDAYGESDG